MDGSIDTPFVEQYLQGQFQNPTVIVQFADNAVQYEVLT